MKIAYGDSRTARKWKNNEISWEDFCKRVSTTQYTTETVEEYKKMTKARRDAIKDVGGYVAGHLKDGRRKVGHVIYRSMLTLDMDNGMPGILDELKMLTDYRMCIYSTHKHTPDAPRLRLVIPMTREVSEDEYPAVGRKVAQEIGMDLFDDSTYEPNRLMYWPSTSSNGEYVYEVLEGELLDPDVYLAKYDDWRDISTWPVSSRESEVVKAAVNKVADPLSKEGIVGVFCRTYSIRDAIEKFLPDVYEPSAMEGRYDYIPADSSAGVQIIEEKFSYSHHATDPACGMLLNAFDVVRVHKFPDDDPKKSFNAMAEFASSDDQVKLNIFVERQQEARMKVDRDDNGRLYYEYTVYDSDDVDGRRGTNKVGRTVRLQPHDVLHIPGLGFDGLVGYSPIAMAKNAIGLAIATEEYGSKFFANGAAPSGVLEHPGTIKDPSKVRESWQATFGGSGNSNKIAVLEEGMKYTPISISPEQAQFLETRKFQIDEIARIFRVPPHMIGDLEKSSFNNIEQQSLEFVKYTLDPWVSRWEQAMVRALLTPDEKKKYFFKFNVDGLLRGDYQSRMNGYATARQNGWMSANDIRELENLDRIPEEDGGDLYLVNGNMVPLVSAGAAYDMEANNGKEEDSDEEVLELEKQEDQRPGFRRRSN